MSVSASSQILLEKTVYKGENAFIGNEAAMDSIASMYIAFKSQLNENSKLLVEISLLTKKLEKLNLQVDFLQKDNNRLELQKQTLNDQISIKQQLYETDLMLWKEKAKGKFRSFIFGTAIGGIIVVILHLL